MQFSRTKDDQSIIIQIRISHPYRAPNTPILPEIQHSTRTSILFDTAGRTVRAVFDTEKNLTFYMNGFTQDSMVGTKLFFGYEVANLYRNVTVDFVGNRIKLLSVFYVHLMAQN